MIDKVKAQELRLAGMTYKQIATELDCSEAWCKKNLKDCEHNKPVDSQLQEVIKLSLTETGITSFQLLGLMMTKDELRDDSKEGKLKKESVLKNTTRKVKAANGVVRPTWMPSESSVEAFDDLIRIVNDLDSRLYEEIELFKKEHNLPDYCYNSVLNAITMTSQIGSLLRGASSTIALVDSYHERAIELRSRNNKGLSKVKAKVDSLVFPEDVPY